MARTAQLNLPLVMPSQAQKHVTVNEALARLDALAQLRVVASDIQDPPATSSDGTSFLVPSGATGGWQGKAGRIAIWCNGGWIFLAPKAGWRAWDESSGGYRLFDGTDWLPDAVAISEGGAGTCWQVIEFDHDVVSGETNSTDVEIPEQSQVLGVTGRVVVGLTGSGLAGWRIGVQGSDDRYGAGIGKALNSVLVGLSGSPVTYYARTPLLLTAEGGAFATGRIRLALHILKLCPPRLV